MLKSAMKGGRRRAATADASLDDVIDRFEPSTNGLDTAKLYGGWVGKVEWFETMCSADLHERSTHRADKRQRQESGGGKRNGFEVRLQGLINKCRYNTIMPAI